MCLESSDNVPTLLDIHNIPDTPDIPDICDIVPNIDVNQYTRNPNSDFVQPWPCLLQLK